jgi:Uma2 family endonuclease
MNSKAVIATDTWVIASWNEYIQMIEAPRLEKAKGYYYNGRMKIEMPPVGNDHASDHTIIIFAVNLFASIKGIPLNGKNNCTYRKTGIQEVQPDVSYYIGENADVVPYGTSIIDLNI